MTVALMGAADASAGHSKVSSMATRTFLARRMTRDHSLFAKSHCDAVLYSCDSLVGIKSKARVQ
jgi:hypothetical protein